MLIQQQKKQKKKTTKRVLCALLRDLLKKRSDLIYSKTTSTGWGKTIGSILGI